MDKLETSIINKLKEVDVDYSTLKPFIKDYLFKIEQIVTDKENIQYEANNVLKNNKFSVASISKELNCSRTTLYNHGSLLKKYIELSESKFRENNPYETLEDLKTEKAIVETQLKRMIERDVSIEVLSYEIDVHLNAIKEKNEEIKRLQERNAELSKENKELRKQLLKSQ
ncbi:hypothetical protein [Candidatus Clostridium stratigraminis]|uniref:Uncharacterized protein n=1 Tax=Candidatus Clostridium stratigraminis TaxID=3381661 RepID=A0ABW8T262_9CLOT